MQRQDLLAGVGLMERKKRGKQRNFPRQKFSAVMAQNFHASVEDSRANSNTGEFEL
jgi:hypothetical protein